MMRISLYKRAFRLLSLGGCWLALSAFTCPIFCTEQTDIQVSYNDARDDCRDYAESKLSAMSGEGDEGAKKTRLVALFSECMKTKGWEVPGPANAGEVTGERASVLPSPMPLYAPAKAAPAAGGNGPQAYDREALQRSADCAWARQNARSSQIAATRAEACDIECRQRLQANPYGLRPAACGPEYPEDRVRKRLIGNMEGEMTPAAGAPQPAIKAPEKKAVKKKAKKKAAKKAPAPKPEIKQSTPVQSPCQSSAQAALDHALENAACTPGQ